MKRWLIITFLALFALLGLKPAYADLLTNGVLFYDTFAEDSVKQWRMTSTSGGSITRTTDQWFDGGASMKFVTDISSVRSSNEIHKYIGKKPGFTKVYWFIRFAVMDENPSNVGFYLGHWLANDDTWRFAQIIHQYDSNTWQYGTNIDPNVSEQTSTLVTFATLDTQESSVHAHWHNLLIGIDYNTNQYIALQLDGVDYVGTITGVGLRNKDVGTSEAFQNQLNFAFETTNRTNPGVIMIDQTWALLMSFAPKPKNNVIPFRQRQREVIAA